MASIRWRLLGAYPIAMVGRPIRRAAITLWNRDPATISARAISSVSSWNVRHRRTWTASGDSRWIQPATAGQYLLGDLVVDSVTVHQDHVHPVPDQDADPVGQRGQVAVVDRGADHRIVAGTVERHDAEHQPAGLGPDLP